MVVASSDSSIEVSGVSISMSVGQGRVAVVGEGTVDQGHDGLGGFGRGGLLLSRPLSESVEGRNGVGVSISMSVGQGTVAVVGVGTVDQGHDSLGGFGRGGLLLSGPLSESVEGGNGVWVSISMSVGQGTVAVVGVGTVDQGHDSLGGLGRGGLLLSGPLSESVGETVVAKSNVVTTFLVAWEEGLRMGLQLVDWQLVDWSSWSSIGSSAQ